jgi:hypothetical protein
MARPLSNDLRERVLLLLPPGSSTSCDPAAAFERECADHARHLGSVPRTNDWKAIATSMDYTGRSVLPVFGVLRPDQVRLEDSRTYIASCRAAGIQDGTIWTRLIPCREIGFHMWRPSRGVARTA